MIYDDIEYNNIIKNNGLFVRRNCFSISDRDQLTSLLKSIDYEPIYYNKKISRYEADINIKNEAVSKIVVSMKSLAQEIGYRNINMEIYAFKYLASNQVPWHRDTKRHKMIAIAYFGEFTGGEYVYQDENGDIAEININKGDLLISINRTECGKYINPYHKVNEIKSGCRYCLAISIINK